jgi:hypothetical protein
MRTADEVAASESGAETAAGMVALEQAARPHEEMNMLYMGFGTGLLIGAFFLVYVVIAFTGLAG